MNGKEIEFLLCSFYFINIPIIKVLFVTFSVKTFNLILHNNIKMNVQEMSLCMALTLVRV